MLLDHYKKQTATEYEFSFVNKDMNKRHFYVCI